MIKNMAIAKRIAPVSALVLGVCFLYACTATEQAPIQQLPANCGLLNDVCGRLQPGEKDQASLRFVSPTAQWTQYNKVMIEPASFWGASSTKVSAEDQQMLTNYLTQQLREHLGKKFELVDLAGPGVLKVSAAMTDAEGATPGLRSVSMIVPQAHMLSNLKYLATGTFPFVGGAQGEFKVTDSVSGEVLAAAADKRIGGGSVAAGFQMKWGDAENTIDKWCEVLTERLSAWTKGTAQP